MFNEQTVYDHGLIRWLRSSEETRIVNKSLDMFKLTFIVVVVSYSWKMENRATTYLPFAFNCLFDASCVASLLIVRGPCASG